jgi:hypothetical protein
VRALLVACKQLQHRLTDIELSIRGILRGFGLNVDKVAKTALLIQFAKSARMKSAAGS